MRIFCSKYRKLQDKITQEIAVLEARKKMNQEDQAKIKITLHPEEWLKYYRIIREIEFQIEALKRVL